MPARRRHFKLPLDLMISGTGSAATEVTSNPDVEWILLRDNFDGITEPPGVLVRARTADLEESAHVLGVALLHGRRRRAGCLPCFQYILHAVVFEIGVEVPRRQLDDAGPRRNADYVGHLTLQRQLEMRSTVRVVPLRFGRMGHTTRTGNADVSHAAAWFRPKRICASPNGP